MADMISTRITISEELDAQIKAYALERNLTDAEAKRELLQLGIEAHKIDMAGKAVDGAIRDVLGQYLERIINMTQDINAASEDLLGPAIAETQAIGYATLARMDELSERLSMVASADQALNLDTFAGYHLMQGDTIATAREKAAREMKLYEE